FYILFRESYFKLTIKRRWNKTLTALLFIVASSIVIAVPLWFALQMVTDKIHAAFDDPVALSFKTRIVCNKFYELTGTQLLSNENIDAIQKEIRHIVPTILNSSVVIFSNLALMYFLLYFMLKGGVQMENFLTRSIPLKRENVDMLSKETKGMIKANAIGIPVLAIIQGLAATLGYWIFGISDFGLWGFLTGVFSLVPIVGTAVVWVPLTAYLYSIGEEGNAIGLLLYSVILTTHIDYVARLTLLKRFMDVHPLVTAIGIIAGLGLFGFWGVIFGPLLVSYFIILVKIYMNEFTEPTEEIV
ncbi:MAG TPA: AI-2E family transporter, partial [Ferruginibacter sp.]|nr:AI-2E family transporter [Ferruginibacter sp.]